MQEDSEEGRCFSDKSAVIVVSTERREWMKVLPFIFASREYQRLINSQSTFGCFEVGPMKRLPVPDSRAIEYVSTDLLKFIDF